MREWLYFGCHVDSGHFLWRANGVREHRHGHPFGQFDGTLCLPRAVGQHVASLSRLGFAGYSVLAFWDYTIDKRPGSNSIIFAPSLDLSALEIAEGAKKHLPLFACRWPNLDVSRAEYRPSDA